MEETRKPDFAGWATKNDIVCEDGKSIAHGAFQHQDKAKVPLIWMHNHKDNEMVLGHVILEHRAEGTWAEAYFNDTTKALSAKAQIIHGDIDEMSIWANNLRLRGDEVVHGVIREVSLVLSGSNKGAKVEQVYIRHSSELEPINEAIITTGVAFISHASIATDETKDVGSLTRKQIFDELPEVEKNVVIAMLNDAYAAGKADSGESEEDAEVIEVKHSATDAEDEDKKDDEDADKDEKSDAEDKSDAADKGEDKDDKSEAKAEDAEDKADDAEDKAEDEQDKDKKSDSEDKKSEEDKPSDKDNIEHSALKGGSNVTAHNAFERNGSATQDGDKLVLSHDAMKVIMTDALAMKSLPDAILKHAGTYGIDNIGVLFPDAKNLDAMPQILGRETSWVPKVLASVRRQPWARVKSLVADLTADEARAKGYITGTEKQDEVIAMLRRTTSPKTVYKKQKLDRDDILDITDFDVIVFIKWEMRYMLDEELARAILIGDGRPVNHADKIKDPAGAIDGIGIRSILNDDSLYTVRRQLPANVEADTVIDEWIRIRADYRGTGNPSLYTSDKHISDALLLKDRMGRFLYDTLDALAARLRVKEIVPVEVFGQVPTVLGIMVNLSDYTVGTDKGGDITFFSDFNLDFNQEIFLLETRPSGGLTVPKSALVLTRETGVEARPAALSFDGDTNTILIPTVVGIEYRVDGEVVAAGDLEITQTTTVTAHAKAGYYIASGSSVSWTFPFTP